MAPGSVVSWRRGAFAEAEAAATDSTAPDGPRDVLVEVALDDLGRKPHAIGDDLAWEQVQPNVEMV